VVAAGAGIEVGAGAGVGAGIGARAGVGAAGDSGSGDSNKEDVPMRSSPRGDSTLSGEGGAEPSDMFTDQKRHKHAVTYR
jgi:hypothetical protein